MECHWGADICESCRSYQRKLFGSRKSCNSWRRYRMSTSISCMFTLQQLCLRIIPAVCRENARADVFSTFLIPSLWESRRRKISASAGARAAWGGGDDRVVKVLTRKKLGGKKLGENRKKLDGKKLGLDSGEQIRMGAEGSCGNTSLICLTKYAMINGNSYKSTWMHLSH